MEIRLLVLAARRNPLLRKSCLMLFAIVCLPVYGVLDVHSQPASRSSAKLSLIQALICEDMKDGIPFNTAVAFSISVGKIYCYTLFDQIPEDTVIYHHWFFRDKPSARIRLTLKSPRWSTYSSIQLREADKGPWRVEISDAGGRVLKTLRFSVTD
jgi:hypothetical protein